ncbi:RNA polymerase-binding protein DksA [Rickettsiales bacterium]|nr:RNA polymerase-binding protein DksA [Rickettsiales bacterium]
MKSEITSNNYEPNQNEKFMNKKQLEYFKNRLLEWKKDLLKESNVTIEKLKEEPSNKPDVTDRASLESDRSLELRTRDRARKLLSKINKALLKIEDGTYGYCEETMEPISIERLKARPIATLTLEAQENHEKSEKVYREKEY